MCYVASVTQTGRLALRVLTPFLAAASSLFITFSLSLAGVRRCCARRDSTDPTRHVMAHRGGNKGFTDSLRRGDLLSGTGAGQFDVQMTHQHQHQQQQQAPPQPAGKAWTPSMQSASRARAQAVKARNERERAAHNRNSVKPPDQCEALVYAMGLGPCVDIVRSCCVSAPSTDSVLNDSNVVRRTDADAACWFIPTPLRWLCCGAETLTLAQEHGFNYVAPRTKGKGDFGQVHDLSVHVPKLQAQAAIEERRNLYFRVAITLILGFLTAASLWFTMPTRDPDAQW